MKLDHLHITDFSPGTIGHRDAVAGRNIWIGSELIDLAHAAGGQNNRKGRERLHSTHLGVQNVQAIDAIVGRTHLAATQFGVRQQIDREMMLEHRDLGLTGNGPEEGRFDGTTRHVTGV